MAEKKNLTKSGSKEVKKRDVADLPEDLMKNFEEHGAGGFENADMDSFAIPFLRILQPNSPQVNEDDEEVYIDGAKPGMFLNTVNSKIYGKEIVLIPVSYYREFIEWKADRGGFVRAHGSIPDILDQCTRNERNQDILPNGNIIQDTRCHVVLIADDLEAGPVIFPLVSTGLRHSKKWMSLMRMVQINGKNAPMYSSLWRFWTTLNKNEDGSWYMIGDRSMHAFEKIGWVNKVQWEAALKAKELLDSGRAKADYEQGFSDEPEKDRDMPF